MKTRLPLLVLSLTAAIAAVAAITWQMRVAAPAAAPIPLTAYVPQDALLTLESPDFASLLHRWTNSAESKAWLASENYAVLQNSRLFGRLGDAQTSFAKAAGVPTGVDLLNQAAGKQSVFAWYDIGNLEFLYITRMSAEQASQTQLFQARGSFQRRHAGSADFYIRTSGGSYGAVAFAVASTPSGDVLLLATREDLIANALTLIAENSAAGAGNSPTSAIGSVNREPWFRDASSALPPEKSPPALHMVLNLDRITDDPHFESYWIQRNITWTRQFRAAASDLYLEPTRFREERALLPKEAEAQPPGNANTDSPDLAALAALAPPSTGVFRATATHDASAAVTAIQEKILGTYTAPAPSQDEAPNPDLNAPQSGSASDLEVRIDTPPPASPTASTEALTHLIQSANIDAVLTLSSAQPPAEQGGLWVPIHSAVVLYAANPTNPTDPRALGDALQQALGGSLTAAGIGIGFQQAEEAGTTVYSLTGPRALFYALPSTPNRGSLVLLADDKPLLLELLHNSAAKPPQAKPAPANLIAGFNQATQRRPYIRLTSLIDGVPNRKPGSASTADPGASAQPPAKPAFFSQDIRSLSDTFATLQSERVDERTVDSNLRQTVTYVWQTP